VPGHAGITGNEEADEEAKRALEDSIPNDEKYLPKDLSGWIKTEMACSRQPLNKLLKKRLFYITELSVRRKISSSVFVNRQIGSIPHN
jgi:hypothetical protein